MKQRFIVYAFLLINAFLNGYTPSLLTGQNIDLELTLLQNISDPDQYTNYTVTARITNNGSTLATGVKVHVPEPNGVVYVGGNDPTTSQGTFDLYGSEEWNVGDLTPGATAQLNLHYFLLAATVPGTYGQVIAASETDLDSTPNNGTPPSVNEDDEANTNTAPPPPKPDLTLSNLQPTAQVNAGTNMLYTVDVSNIGSATAFSWGIGVFVSQDDQLSADDVAMPVVSFPFYDVGTNNYDFYFTTPASLTPGPYFLILNADQLEAVDELDEGNNMVAAAFEIIDPNICQGNIVLNSQAEVDAFQNCSTINGNLAIQGNDITDLTSLNTLQHIIGSLTIQDNPNLAICCGVYPLLNDGGVTGQIIIQNNLPNCNSEVEILTACEPVGEGEIDLELSLASPSTAPIYSSYPITLTLTNTGAIAATGIKIHFPKPLGVVYTGGNEYTVSAGSFNPFGGEEWSLPSLGANESATLTVNYFLLQNDLPTVYAQVTAANEPDIDSTPDNGTPPSVNEDDEATSSDLPPGPLPDFRIFNLDLQNSQLQAGGILDFAVDLTNQGNAAISSNYSIKYWLSTDNSISPDDIQGQLPFFSSFTPGFTVTDILGETALSGNLLNGDYYLIVKADADEEIIESDEGNNIVFQSFSVIDSLMDCSGDVILESQVEVNNFQNCAVIDGNLIIRSPFGSTGASSDINDLSPLLSLTEITGDIILENNDQLFNLHGLENLTACSALYIGGCENLNSIYALSGLSGELNDIVIFQNPSLSLIEGLIGITAVKNSIILDSNTDLQNLNGFSNLTIIREGQLILNGNTSLTNIQGLSNLTSIGSDLAITNCNALQNLNGLNNITTLNIFHLGFNDVLQDVNAMSALTNVDLFFFVSFNPLLADCCIFYDLLNNNGVGGLITIESNAGLCNSPSDILNNCLPSNGVDLSLAMSTTNSNPAIYSSNEVTLAISNEGSQMATGIVVEFPRPNSTVYTGGNEWSATQGGFNAFGNEQWTVGNLGAGESASITVSYFLLTGNTLIPYAQVIDQNEADADSTPDNGTPPSVNEDDEAAIVLNDINGGGGTSLQTNLRRQRLSFDRIYPNPAQHWITLEIYSQTQQITSLEFYDITGRSVHFMEVELKPGHNEVELNVSDWRSGTYNVVGHGEGHPAYGRFMKVWED